MNPSKRSRLRWLILIALFAPVVPAFIGQLVPESGNAGAIFSLLLFIGSLPILAEVLRQLYEPEEPDDPQASAETDAARD